MSVGSPNYHVATSKLLSAYDGWKENFLIEDMKAYEGFGNVVIRGDALV
jgi:hypothetical protein